MVNITAAKEDVKNSSTGRLEVGDRRLGNKGKVRLFLESLANNLFRSFGTRMCWSHVASQFRVCIL